MTQISLVQHGPTGRYIAIMSLEVGPEFGFYVSDSADLIHWSAPKKIMENEPTSVEHQCGKVPTFHYPSLIDPGSPSRNFEVVGNTAYLYFTQFNRKGCTLDLNRDLIRVPVTITFK